jgi:hypothetical protein
MSDDKLKLVEACALLLLLQEAQEISNADLKNARGLELKKENRERLAALGLIEVREEKRRIYLNLSEKAWTRRLFDAIGTEPPARSGYQGAAIYGQVAALRQFLDTSGLALSDYFVPQEQKPVPAVATPDLSVEDVMELICKAYAGLARRPGDAVKLVRIRAELSHVERGRIDEALIGLDGRKDVRLFAEANQKTLSDADRAAAVNVGNQDLHLLAIG